MSALKNAVRGVLQKLPLPTKNIILFESTPAFSDNTKAVFDELLRRGWNQTYEFVWVVSEPVENFSDVNLPNVRFVARSDAEQLKALTFSAKMQISCNEVFVKHTRRQFTMYLAHGCALKDVRGKYNLPASTDCALTLSPYIGQYDAQNLGYPAEKMLPLGYPRNDELFGEPLDLNPIFPNADFQKAIYWMPTYRQHKNGSVHSNVSMPILYNEEIARKVNDCAAKNGVLLIIKPHFVQDVSKIKSMDLSHLKFIDNDFLVENGISNYGLLRSADAMLSDYSSVYYDYLLTDKPIGLCWDDFEEYSAREGFLLDPQDILAGGVKIYTPEDLCAFVESVAKGEDALRTERRAIRDRVHAHADNGSAARVADFLEQYLR